MTERATLALLAGVVVLGTAQVVQLRRLLRATEQRPARHLHAVPGPTITFSSGQRTTRGNDGNHRSSWGS